MKRLIFTLILISCFGWAHSQKIQIGPQLGANITDRYVESESKRIGINAGGIANIQFSDLFSLHTGLLFSQKGSNGLGQTRKVRYSYLTIPVTPQLNFGDGTEIFIRGGGYASRNVFAENGGEEINKAINDYDLGIQAGTGLIKSCGNESLRFEVSYSLGAMPLRTDDKRSVNLYNSTLAVSVGYLFGTK